jgi:hypothetical protein
MSIISIAGPLQKGLSAFSDVVCSIIFVYPRLMPVTVKYTCSAFYRQALHGMASHDLKLLLFCFSNYAFYKPHH